MGSDFKTDRLLNRTDHLHTKYIDIYFVSVVTVENDRITTDKDVVFWLPFELDLRKEEEKYLN